MSIELFNPTKHALKSEESQIQQSMLNKSTSFELQKLLKDSNPEEKIKTIQSTLSKNPGLISKFFKGNPDPMIKEFQQLSLKDQSEFRRELAQLAHKAKINLLEQQANFYIQNLSMYNAANLAHIATTCIEQVRNMTDESERRFIEKFDKRMKEIEEMYSTQQAKDLAYRRLHQQMSLHEETMDELFKKTTDSLRARLPTDDNGKHFSLSI